VIPFARADSTAAPRPTPTITPLTLSTRNTAWSELSQRTGPVAWESPLASKYRAVRAATVSPTKSESRIGAMTTRGLPPGPVSPHAAASTKPVRPRIPRRARFMGGMKCKTF